MFKRITSFILSTLIILSIFTLAPVSTAYAGSYKEKLIDEIMKKDYMWCFDALFENGYYGYGRIKFMDLNFDGNLEFIVTFPCGSMRNVSNQVYTLKNSTLTPCSGGENLDSAFGFIGDVDSVYYNKSTGTFKNVCSNIFMNDYANWMQANYTLELVNNTVKVKYHSAKVQTLKNGTPVYTYYNGAKHYGSVSGRTKISKSKFDSINNSITKNCVNTKFKVDSLSMENWYKYSNSKMRSLLSDLYDSYTVKKNLVTKPSIKKFEGRSNGVKITWKAVSGAKSYRIYQKTSAGWKTVGTTTGTTFTDKTLKVGQKRTYTIKCLSKNNKYAISSYDSTGRSFLLAQTPVISKTQYVKGGVKLIWSKPKGAVNYRVFVKTGSTWKKLGDTKNAYFTHKTGKNGKKYTYTVRCITASGKTYTSYYDTTGKTVKFKK